MSTNNKTVHILVLFCVLFFSIIAYLTYFQLFQSNSLKKHPQNPRTYRDENKILRGKIFDKNNILLAESKYLDDGTQQRYYPFGKFYCHVIGYRSTTYGKNQLELQYNDELLNRSPLRALNDFKDALSGGKSKGHDLQLTIDHRLQKLAMNSLNNIRGSVVAIEPSTGKVLALVSNPAFDPNNLKDAFEKSDDSNPGHLIPRATNSTYPPGSTFKVLTSICAMENGMSNFRVNDEGYADIDGQLIRNAGGKSFGNLDMRKALTVSSNVYFGQLGLKLGGKAMVNMEEKALLNKNIKFDIPLKRSTFDQDKVLSSRSKTELGAISFGQGTLRVSPLHVALIASAVANDGVMMKPYLVENIISSTGKLVKQTSPSPLTTLTSPEIANEVTSMMVNVVQNGTGSGSRLSNIKVAGKTGTAENEVKGKEHGWFMAFAPADNPQIAIAIIDEYSGTSGGSVCAPIAKKLISSYINNTY